MDPGQDRGKVIRDCKKKLNASVAEDDLVMEDDLQHWKSEVAKDQQAVSAQEDLLREEWQRLRLLRSAGSGAAHYKSLGLYPVGNLEEYEQRLKEIYDTEERAKEEEREGDELAAKLESEDPEANYGLCKQQLGLTKRKQESISIQPVKHSGILDSTIFQITVLFFTFPLIPLDPSSPVFRERPRDATGKFYIFRRPSGAEVLISPVEEEPEQPEPELPKSKRSSTAKFLEGKYLIALL